MSAVALAPRLVGVCSLALRRDVAALSFMMAGPSDVLWLKVLRAMPSKGCNIGDLPPIARPSNVRATSLCVRRQTRIADATSLPRGARPRCRGSSPAVGLGYRGGHRVIRVPRSRSVQYTIEGAR